MTTNPMTGADIERLAAERGVTLESVWFAATTGWSLDAMDEDEPPSDDALLAEKWAEKQETQDSWTDEDSKALKAAFGF